MIVFIFSSIFAFFSNLCVFSPTPPQIFSIFSYPTRFGARSLLRTHVLPFGPYKRSYQPRRLLARGTSCRLGLLSLHRCAGVRKYFSKPPCFFSKPPCFFSKPPCFSPTPPPFFSKPPHLSPTPPFLLQPTQTPHRAAKSRL